MKKYIFKGILAFLLLYPVCFYAVSQQYQYTTVKTPNNSTVGADKLISGEYNTSEKNQLAAYWLLEYGYRILLLGEATHKYNCHAYAWHMSEGGNQVWIDSPGDDQYWDDLSYVETAYPLEATKVSFGTPCWAFDPYFGTYDACKHDHSAITSHDNDPIMSEFFISKWGPSPLFRHHKDDCPYSPDDLHYYKRGPTISGPSIVSGQAEFTLQGLSSGTSIQWSTSNNHLVLVSGQGTATATFQGNYFGPCTINAAINMNNKNATISKPVNVDIVIPNNVYLDGPNFVCGSSGTFTVRNLPQPATVAWNGSWPSTDTSRVVYVSEYSGNAGFATVQVLVDYKGKTLGLEHRFHFHYPYSQYVDESVMPDFGYIYDHYGRGISGVFASYAYPVPGTYYEWTCSNNWTITGGGYGSDFAIFEGEPATGYFNINLCYNNPCGGRTCLSREFYIPYNSYGMFTVYPNPTSNVLNIEINKAEYEQSRTSAQSLTDGKALKQAPTFDIRLYDGQGNLLRHAKAKDGSIQFNVSNLPNGIYYLHIYDGINEKPDMRQIVVEK